MIKITAGSHEGWIGYLKGKQVIIQENKLLFPEKIELNHDTVKEFELVTEDSRKSATSGILRGAAGAALLGPVGLLAGVSAKNKNKFTVAIEYHNGERDLLIMDKPEYERFYNIMF